MAGAGRYNLFTTYLGDVLKLDRSTRRRLKIAGVGFAVVALSGAGFVGFRQYQQAAYADARCSELNAQLASEGPTRTVSQGKPRVMVLGDSYSTGEVLADPTKGWVYRIGASEKWETVVDGIGATGYTTGGYCADDYYRTRADNVLRVKPQMLIIEGGLNDSNSSPESVGVAARELFDRFESIPRIVVVGPTNAPRKDHLSEIDAAIRGAAESRGLQYVSAMDWDVEFSADRLHMTEAGHAEFAHRVAASLG